MPILKGGTYSTAACLDQALDGCVGKQMMTYVMKMRRNQTNCALSSQVVTTSGTPSSEIANTASAKMTYEVTRDGDLSRLYLCIELPGIANFHGTSGMASASDEPFYHQHVGLKLLGGSLQHHLGNLKLRDDSSSASSDTVPAPAAILAHMIAEELRTNTERDGNRPNAFSTSNIEDLKSLSKTPRTLIIELGTLSKVNSNGFIELMNYHYHDYKVSLTLGALTSFVGNYNSPTNQYVTGTTNFADDALVTIVTSWKKNTDTSINFEFPFKGTPSEFTTKAKSLEHHSYDICMYQDNIILEASEQEALQAEYSALLKHDVLDVFTPAKGPAGAKGHFDLHTDGNVESVMVVAYDSSKTSPATLLDALTYDAGPSKTAWTGGPGTAPSTRFNILETCRIQINKTDKWKDSDAGQLNVESQMNMAAHGIFNHQGSSSGVSRVFITGFGADNLTVTRASAKASTMLFSKLNKVTVHFTLNQEQTDDQHLRVLAITREMNTFTLKDGMGHIEWMIP